MQPSLRITCWDAHYRRLYPCPTKLVNYRRRTINRLFRSDWSHLFLSLCLCTCLFLFMSFCPSLSLSLPLPFPYHSASICNSQNPLQTRLDFDVSHWGCNCILAFMLFLLVIFSSFLFALLLSVLLSCSLIFILVFCHSRFLRMKFTESSMREWRALPKHTLKRFPPMTPNWTLCWGAGMLTCQLQPTCWHTGSPSTVTCPLSLSQDSKNLRSSYCRNTHLTRPWSPRRKR